MTSNLKVYFKSLKGKFILTFAGISTGAVVMSGCNGEIVVTTENPSEVITSEVPSEIEEISEEPSEVEEISEEPSEIVEEKVEMPELPIRDENGEIYVPDEITLEEVYAKIDELEENNDLSELDRDKIISTMLYINAPYLSEETFRTVKGDYLRNMGDSDALDFSAKFLDSFRNKKNIVSIKYIIIDEKQALVADKIEKYYNSKEYSADEHFNLTLNYFEELANNKLYYLPLNIICYETLTYRKQAALLDELEQRGISRDNSLKIISQLNQNISDYYYAVVNLYDEKTYKYTTLYDTRVYNNYHSSHSKGKTLELTNK